MYIINLRSTICNGCDWQKETADYNKSRIISCPLILSFWDKKENRQFTSMLELIYELLKDIIPCKKLHDENSLFHHFHHNINGSSVMHQP